MVAEERGFSSRRGRLVVATKNLFEVTDLIIANGI